MQITVVVMGVIVGVVVSVAARVAMRVAMPMLVPAGVGVAVNVVMIVGVALDPCIPASANRAHQTTSKSLIRISSPPVGISLPLPQSGQGSSRWAISTSLPQS